MTGNTHLGPSAPTDISPLGTDVVVGPTLVGFIMTTRYSRQYSPVDFDKTRFITHRFCRIHGTFRVSHTPRLL